jgi:TolA-binding protein
MKNLLFIITLSALFTACSNNNNEIKVEAGESEKPNIIDTQEERKAEIDKYSALLYSDSLNVNIETHRQYAENLLSAYEQYIQYHSFQSDSKEIQFFAGELAKKLGKPHVAIKHFNGLLERDPKHEKAGMALFYKATIIGDVLHEDDLAIKTYQEFIDNYPDHPFVESAKESIKLQGKSLDEIIEGFEKKNS